MLTQNKRLEGFLLDTFGAALAHSVAQMTTRQGIVFFALSTAKTVDDHCGFKFPWDPFQILCEPVWSPRQGSPSSER